MAKLNVFLNILYFHLSSKGENMCYWSYSKSMLVTDVTEIKAVFQALIKSSKYKTNHTVHTYSLISASVCLSFRQKQVETVRFVPTKRIAKGDR